MTCCERLHTSANIAQQETTLLGPTMLRVVASVCTGLNIRPTASIREGNCHLQKEQGFLYRVLKQATVDNFPVGVRWISGLILSALFQVEKLNILSKSQYNVDLQN